MRFAMAAVLSVLVSGSVADAQTVYRLKGTTKTESGAPVGAAIRGEALNGYRGQQFVGQKELAVSANEKGEWNMLGVTAGVWLFTASASGTLPGAIVLPIKFAQRQMQSAQGGQLSWSLPFVMLNADEHPGLKQAAALALEKRETEALQFIAPALAPDSKPAVQCAAAQIALVLKHTGVAQQLFNAVQKADPKSACGPLGLASVALMINDWDTAAKMLWAARDLAPRDQRAALAAAIAELQQVATTK